MKINCSQELGIIQAVLNTLNETFQNTKSPDVAAFHHGGSDS